MQSESDSIAGPQQHIWPIEKDVNDSKKKSAQVEEDNKKASRISRQLNFNVPSETTKERARISLFSKIQSTNSVQSFKQSHDALSPTTSQISPIPTGDVEVVSLDDGSMSNSTIPAPTKCGGDLRALDSSDIIDTINKTNTIEPIQKNAEDLTPYEKFQMPLTRRLPPSNRRLAPNDIIKSAQDSEFRSQKVLFTTPSAVSRPIINLLNNVGLDDSLNCYKSSPILTKSSQEQRQHHLHDVNSSEAIPTEHFAKEENNTAQIGGQKKIMRINGKDFVVLKKIGQGGSSSVFLAEHKEKNLECALKVRQKIDDVIFFMS